MVSKTKSLQINENLVLSQSTDGLTFGTDAYMLAAYMKGGSKQSAADLGSGTGVISLLCQSKGKFNHIYAIEIQERFAALIEKNADENHLNDKITPICADLRNIKAEDVGGELDCVFSNPPYMKIDSGKRNEHDEKFIARHEVYGQINDFCACARRLLKHGGKFYTVWRPDRLADLMCALRENKLEPKVIIFIHAYPSAPPSMILTEAVKGGASGNKLYRPLYLSDSLEDSKNSILSDDARKIYDTCSFEEFIEKKK
ncbi:MAG: methyltransferase domain-containing protein [Ruminococcaceae bacterium]|nr:methyltransferase domain-containing protein [Oscillospiraceae bacterium]